MVQLNFNATQVQPSGSSAVYDSGIYTVCINESSLVETKAKKEGRANKGSMFLFRLRIMDGENQGGSLPYRVNYENDNATAEEIGAAQLSALCHVTGQLQLQDTQQLHGIPFKVEVAKVERNDKPGSFGNEINGVMDINGNQPGQAGSGQAPQQQAPQAPVQQQAHAVQQQQQQQQPVQQQQPAPAATQSPPWAQNQAQQPAPGSAPPWAQSQG